RRRIVFAATRRRDSADRRDARICGPGTVAGTSGCDRREASAGNGAECLHRFAGACAGTDRIERDFPGGRYLALISAPYTRGDGVQGSLGVIGPTRMHYERAINAVASVAQIFSETLSKIS